MSFINVYLVHFVDDYLILYFYVFFPDTENSHEEDILPEETTEADSDGNLSLEEYIPTPRRLRDLPSRRTAAAIPACRRTTPIPATASNREADLNSTGCRSGASSPPSESPSESAN